MEMYEHSLICGHVKFAVWGYWDIKERVCCFSNISFSERYVGEGLFTNQKTLSTCLFVGGEKKEEEEGEEEEEKYSTEAFL